MAFPENRSALPQEKLIASLACYLTAGGFLAAIAIRPLIHHTGPGVFDFLLLLPIAVLVWAGFEAKHGDLLDPSPRGYVIRRAVTVAMATAIGIITAYLTVALAVPAVTADPFRMPSIWAFIALGVTVGATRTAWLFGKDTLDGRYLIGREYTPASPETIRGVIQIIDTACGWSKDERDRHEALFEAHADEFDVDSAATRAHLAAAKSGRSVNYDMATAWPELSILNKMAPCAAVVAIAVLCRDLISAADFEALTDWWIDADLPLSGPADTRFDGYDDEGLPIHRYQTGKRSEPDYVFRRRMASRELAQQLAQVSCRMVLALAGKFTTSHRRTLAAGFDAQPDHQERHECFTSAFGIASVCGRIAEVGLDPMMFGRSPSVGYVALAVLVRDMLSPENFTPLIAHWAAEGLPVDPIGYRFPHQVIGAIRNHAYCLPCALTHLPTLTGDTRLIGNDEGEFQHTTCHGCGELLPGDPDRIAAILTGQALHKA